MYGFIIVLIHYYCILVAQWYKIRPFFTICSAIYGVSLFSLYV